MTDEAENFSLVITHRSTSEILVTRSDNHIGLPTATIPRGQRTARSITERLLEQWNLPTVLLFQSEISDRAHDSARSRYLALEARDCDWKLPKDLAWVSGKELCAGGVSTSEVSGLREILRRADAYQTGVLGGPFARTGWFEKLMSWAQESVVSRGLTINGRFQQFNGDPFFSLVRLETTGPALWFKAVGEPNLHEYSITLELATNHPRYLPVVVAAKPEWNGWLMLEADGDDFLTVGGIEVWQRLIQTFASLQLECIGHNQRLLEVGCKDRRIATLIQQIDPFIETMAALMQEQGSEPPPRLSQFELSTLGHDLRNVCIRMQLAGIPDSLFHGDFNPGSVRMNSNSCVFLDWAEGCLGPPFLTLEYLIALLHRADSGFAQGEQHIRRAYAACWSEIATEHQVAEGMRLAGPLAVFCYALGSAAWNNRALLKESRIAKYLRSLTRRLKRELDALDLSKATT